MCIETSIEGAMNGCGYRIRYHDEDGETTDVNIPGFSFMVVGGGGVGGDETTVTLKWGGVACASFCLKAEDCGVPLTQGNEPSGASNEDVLILQEQIDEQQKTINYLIKEIEALKKSKK